MTLLLKKKTKGGKKSRDASQLFIRSCDSLRSNKPTNESRGRRRMSMSRALTACALIAEIFYRDRDSRRICQLEVREEVIIFPVRNDSDDELAVAEALFCAWLVRTYVRGERRVVRADTYVGIPSQLQRQCRALSLYLSLFLSLTCMAMYQEVIFYYGGIETLNCLATALREAVIACAYCAPRSDSLPPSS